MYTCVSKGFLVRKVHTSNGLLNIFQCVYNIYYTKLVGQPFASLPTQRYPVVQDVQWDTMVLAVTGDFKSSHLKGNVEVFILRIRAKFRSAPKDGTKHSVKEPQH